MTYTRTQISLHWITAILILVMLGTGLAYSYDLADSGAIATHQIAGQVLIVVLVARMLAKFRNRRAVRQTAHARWERMTAHSVHIGLYLCLIAFVVTGYVAASALRDPMLVFPADLAFARSETGEAFLDTHFLMKWVLLGLLAAHFAGSIKHHFIDRDDTLSNMTFSTRKD
ncbi:MAG: cytochrome b/b6 domain-containing protein [Pseudomonadota bacterium]